MYFVCKCSHTQTCDRARTHVHAHTNTGELKDLRQQVYDIQQVHKREAKEREREQHEHRAALSSLNSVLEETRTAHESTQFKLTTAEQKLAATELQLAQAQTHTQTDKATDASHTPSADVAPAPVTKPNPAGSRPASKISEWCCCMTQNAIVGFFLNAQTLNTSRRWAAERERSENNAWYKGDTWCGDKERNCRGSLQERGA